MMKLLLDYIIVILIITVLCFGWFLVGKGCGSKDKLLDSQFLRIDQNIGQSANKYVFDSEIIDKARQSFSGNMKIEYDNIGALTDATYLIRSYAKKNNKVDLECVYDGKLKYVFHEVHLKSQDGEVGPAIGYVMIYSNGKVVSKAYNYKVEAHTMIQEEKKNYKVTNSVDLIMLQSGLAVRKDSSKKDWRNIPYALPIENAETFINIEKMKKGKIVFDFSPDLGINTIITLKDKNIDLVPNIGFSLISYKKDGINKFRFIRFGIGGRKIRNGFNYSFSPILYNLHDLILFLDNTYIGPIIGYDNRKFNLGAAITLKF